VFEGLLSSVEKRKKPLAYYQNYTTIIFLNFLHVIDLWYGLEKNKVQLKIIPTGKKINRLKNIIFNSKIFYCASFSMKKSHLYF
jgi:hypothetical protein